MERLQKFHKNFDDFWQVWASLALKTGFLAEIQESHFNFSEWTVHGILMAEINNFCWPPKRSRNRPPFPGPFTLAYLQDGAADIFHIMFAHHLGRQYFASFDSDFRRAEDFLAEVGMTLLASPEETPAVM